MISEKALGALQAENAALRGQLKVALQRLSDLEAKKYGAPSTPRPARNSVAGFSGREPKRHALNYNLARSYTSRRKAPQMSANPNAMVARPSASGRDCASRSGNVRAVRIQSVAGLQTSPKTVAQDRHMSTLHRATSNTIMLLLGQLATWVCTLILTAAYGRFLGAEKFGELYLAITFTTLIGFPIEFSFNQQIVRDVVRAPRDVHRYLTIALALKGALWVGLYALTMLLSVLLGYSGEQRWLIGICGLMLVSTAVSSTLIAIQTAFMQAGLAKFGTVIEKMLDAILIVLLLRAGAGVQVAALVLLFGSIVGMVWQLARVMRMIGIRLIWDSKITRALVHSGMSFFVYGVLGVIYYRVDTVLLSVIGTEAAVGVYGAAYRLLDTLMFVPGIVLGSIVSPLMSKYSVDDDNKLRLTVEKSVLAMLLCSLPAAAGLLATAPNIIGFVYHRNDFAGSAAVLQALALGVVALYLNSVLTTVLVSTGQERKLPFMAAVALVFNVAINLVLIPRFGAGGAAWATSLTEVLLLVIGIILIDRSLIPVHLWGVAGKIAVASVVMAIVAHALASLNVLIIISVAAVVYVVVVALLGVLSEEDLAHLKQSFSRFMPRFAMRSAPRLRYALLNVVRIARYHA